MKSINYFTSTVNLIISSLVGSILGMFNSLLVNFTLLEISTSDVFSKYLGTIIILAGASIGIILLIKKDGTYNDRSIFRMKKEKLNMAKKTYFYCYSFTLIFCGVTVIFLNTQFYIGMSYFYKLPVYTLISVSFSISFSLIIIELINTVQTIMEKFENEIKIIHSYHQYLIILIVSVISGTIFAVIFSFIEFNSLSYEYLFKLQLLKETNYCVPIGLGIGCLLGYVNEYIRSEINNNDFHPIDNTGDEDV